MARARSLEGGSQAHPYLAAAAIATGLLVISAGVNAWLAKRAERANPPMGRFIEVDGVRLHYVEAGEGQPLVLFHGNGSMIQDFGSSGLIDMASRTYRVIVFDRPGYGYSDRPRGTVWTNWAQAELFDKALKQLGVRDAIVLGHSWGASVAAALALSHPDMVRGLVLASGYYYPSVRMDVAVFSIPAIPVIGDVVRYSISPLLTRLLWPLLLRRVFGPSPIPPKFRDFPKEMAVRPSQLRASAAESGLMIPDAASNRSFYAGLTMPVVIIAGTEDRNIDFHDQSARLHRELPQSTLRAVTGAGHMVHQTAQEATLAAIDEAAGMQSGGATRTDQPSARRALRASGGREWRVKPTGL
jgi:pimeloyl-ACP methyl ester carboxylesterase